MGIDFSKFKEAIKKLANKPSTSDVNRSSNNSSSNTSSSSNFSSNTYESNIFYDEQIGSPSFDNKIKQELEEKGYNVEDVTTLLDRDGDGSVNTEETEFIDGLDGKSGLSVQDIEDYVTFLSNMDMDSFNNNPETAFQQIDTYIDKIEKFSQMKGAEDALKQWGYNSFAQLEKEALDYIVPLIEEREKNTAIATALLGYSCIQSPETNQQALELINNYNYIRFENTPYSFSLSMDEQRVEFNELLDSCNIKNAQVIYDEDGHTIKEVIISTSNSDEQIKLQYNKDGSFSLSVGEKTITSEEITLHTLNNMGENINENMEGNSLLADNVRNAKTYDEAFDVLVNFCNGDKETARKLFNGIYAENELQLDENFQLNQVTTEQETGVTTKTPIDVTTANILYKKDMTAVTNRLFSYRSQERVINEKLLQQFSTTQTKTIYGQELPSGGNEYYVNAEGELCQYTYEITYDENMNMEITSDTRRASDGSVLCHDVVNVYTADDGSIRVKIDRKDLNNNTLEVDESWEEYQKRLIVERNYASDIDGDGLISFNLSSKDIDQMYSTMLQDSQYANVVTQFGKQLNSEGIADNIYNWAKEIFGSDNTAKIVANEIIQRSAITPVINSFIQGDTSTALEQTQSEFERRISNAETIDEIYDITISYYGDEDIAFEVARAYVEQNQDKIQYKSDVPYTDVEYSLEKTDEGKLILNVTENVSGFGYNKTHTTQIDITSQDVKISKGTDLSSIELDDTVVNAMNTNAPKTYENLYSFWTNGGEYTPENIEEFQHESNIYSQYNASVMYSEQMEQSLAEAQTPQEMFNVFLSQTNGDEAKAVEAFNKYYAQLFDPETKFYNLKNDAEFSLDGSYYIDEPIYDYGTPSGISVTIGPNGPEFCVNLEMSDGTIHQLKDESLLTTILINTNYQVKKHSLFEQVNCYNYQNAYREKYNDTNMPEENMSYKEFTEYINGNYAEAYAELYGDSAAQNAVNEYCTDMDSYAGKLTAMVQMGSIGLSFVFPAFGFVAMGAGFIDNTIDLVNMNSNKQYDDYKSWILNTGFELGCLLGGMALGKFANSVGDKAKTVLLNADKSNKTFAYIAGTGVEVAVDIATGIGFDFITSKGESWNFQGNAFSGFLDIVSGMRGYSAFAAARNQIRPDSLSFLYGGKSVTMQNGWGEDIKLDCIGYDAKGNLIYSDATGKMITLGSSSGIDVTGFTKSALMDGLTSNPLLAQRMMADGIRFNPASGQFETVSGHKVDLGLTEDGTNKFITEKVYSESGELVYTQITPSEFIMQGIGTTDCGYAAILNRALMNENGINQMYGAIREYPDGHIEVETPFGTVKTQATLEDGIMAIYKEVMPSSTHLGGSFADETAALMGLNPIRVEVGENGTFSPQALSSLKGINDESVLLLGVRYEDGSGHYLTIQDFNSQTGIAKVVDPTTGTSREIDLNNPPDDLKIEEIAGGTTKAIDGELYTARPEDSIPFAGKGRRHVQASTDFSQKSRINMDKYVRNLESILGIDLSEIDMAKFETDPIYRRNTLSSYSTPERNFTEIEYLRAKNDAFAQTMKENNVIEINGRKIFVTEAQKIEYETRLNTPIEVNPSYSKQLIMSDAMFLEAMATYSGYTPSQINSMTKEELFASLQMRYFDGEVDLSGANIKPEWLEAYFYRDSYFEPITNVGKMSGDMAVHEMCKALVECEAPEFHKSWSAYCEDPSSTTYKEYAVLADTYKAELKSYIVEAGYPPSQVDALLESTFENLDHIIFRALQRDGIASVEIRNWANGAREDDISTLMKELSDIVLDNSRTTQRIGELVLKYEKTDSGAYKFSTLEYATDDWATNAVYYPH